MKKKETYERDMVDGTQCETCYCIFAKVKGFKIGMRTLFEDNHGSIYIGFRVRAMPDKVTEEDQEVDFNQGKNIADAFPGFTFGKMNKTRASLMGGLYIQGPLTGKSMTHFMYSNRVVSKTIAEFNNCLGDIKMLNEDDLYEFMTDQFGEHVGNYGAGHDTSEGALPTPEGTVISMDKHKANMAFQNAETSDESGKLPYMGETTDESGEAEGDQKSDDQKSDDPEDKKEQADIID